MNRRISPQNFDRLNILVLDDDSEDRENVREMLGTSILNIERIFYASDCRAAFEVLSSNNIHVALVDFSLPDGNGLQVVEKIRQAYPETISIVITGNESEKLAQAVLRKGAQDYIQKEALTPQALNASIRHSLERHRLLVDLCQRERSLVEANRQLAEASKAKSNFLSYISHEVRTPLSLVTGIADLLANTTLNSSQSKYVRSFQKASAHILDIVNDILDLTKIESIGFQKEISKFSLREFAKEFTELAESACSLKELEFQFFVEPDVQDIVHSDRRALKQVLLNLINNSIKFTENGFVHIYVSNLSFNLKTGLPKLRFEVRDSGVGLDEKEMNILFQRYSQGKSKSLGKARSSGLGLHLAQEIITALGGQISVQSTPDNGTSFFVEIDRAPTSGVSHTFAKDVDKQPSELKTPALRVLFADDDSKMRELLNHYFSSSHLKVEYAENGLAAIRKMQTQIFDIVFLDMNMPDIDGHLVLKKARAWESRQALPRTPIFACTGDVFKADVDRAKASGFDGFMAKPLEKKSLFQTLETYPSFFAEGRFYTSDCPVPQELTS